MDKLDEKELKQFDEWLQVLKDKYAEEIAIGTGIVDMDAESAIKFKNSQIDFWKEQRPKFGKIGVLDPDLRLKLAKACYCNSHMKILRASLDEMIRNQKNQHNNQSI